MIIPKDESLPSDLGLAFDTDKVIKAAYELVKGTTQTKPGCVDIHELAFEMHRHFTRLTKVLIDNGWREVRGHPDFYLPPEGSEDE